MMKNHAIKTVFALLTVLMLVSIPAHATVLDIPWLYAKDFGQNIHGFYQGMSDIPDSIDNDPLPWGPTSVVQVYYSGRKFGTNWIYESSRGQPVSGTWYFAKNGQLMGPFRGWANPDNDPQGRWAPTKTAATYISNNIPDSLLPSPRPVTGWEHGTINTTDSNTTTTNTTSSTDTNTSTNTVTGGTLKTGTLGGLPIGSINLDPCKDWQPPFDADPCYDYSCKDGQTVSAKKQPPSSAPACRTYGECVNGEFPIQNIVCPSNEACSMASGQCENKCNSYVAHQDGCFSYTCDTTTGNEVKKQLPPPSVDSCHVVQDKCSTEGKYVITEIQKPTVDACHTVNNTCDASIGGYKVTTIAKPSVDSCHTVSDTCDPKNGYKVSTIQKPTTDACHIVSDTCDSVNGYKVTTIQKPTVDACHSVSDTCDPKNGYEVSTIQKPTTDACHIVSDTCDSVNGYKVTTIQKPTVDACHSVSDTCDPKNGYKIDAITVPSDAPNCAQYDPNSCDVTTGKFALVPTTCPSGQSCNEASGKCEDTDKCADWKKPSDLCHDYSCDSNTGDVKQTDLVAPSDSNLCHTYSCDSRTGFNFTEKTCASGQSCNPTNGQCETICVDNDPGDGEQYQGHIRIKGVPTANDTCSGDLLVQVDCAADGSVVVHDPQKCSKGICMSGVCRDLCRGKSAPLPSNPCQVVGSCDSTTGIFSESAKTCAAGLNCNIQTGNCEEPPKVAEPTPEPTPTTEEAPTTREAPVTPSVAEETPAATPAPATVAEEVPTAPAPFIETVIPEVKVALEPSATETPVEPVREPVVEETPVATPAPATVAEDVPTAPAPFIETVIPEVKVALEPPATETPVEPVREPVVEETPVATPEPQVVAEETPVEQTTGPTPEEQLAAREKLAQQLITIDRAQSDTRTITPDCYMRARRVCWIDTHLNDNLPPENRTDAIVISEIQQDEFVPISEDDERLKNTYQVVSREEVQSGTLQDEAKIQLATCIRRYASLCADPNRPTTVAATCDTAGFALRYPERCPIAAETPPVATADNTPPTILDCSNAQFAADNPARCNTAPNEPNIPDIQAKNDHPPLGMAQPDVPGMEIKAEHPPLGMAQPDVPGMEIKAKHPPLGMAQPDVPDMEIKSKIPPAATIDTAQPNTAAVACNVPLKSNIFDIPKIIKVTNPMKDVLSVSVVNVDKLHQFAILQSKEDFAILDPGTPDLKSVYCQNKDGIEMTPVGETKDGATLALVSRNGTIIYNPGEFLSAWIGAHGKPFAEQLNSEACNIDTLLSEYAAISKKMPMPETSNPTEKPMIGSFFMDSNNQLYATIMDANSPQFALIGVAQWTIGGIDDAINLVFKPIPLELLNGKNDSSQLLSASINNGKISTDLLRIAQSGKSQLYHCTFAVDSDMTCASEIPEEMSTSDSNKKVSGKAFFEKAQKAVKKGSFGQKLAEKMVDDQVNSDTTIELHEFEKFATIPNAIMVSPEGSWAVRGDSNDNITKIDSEALPCANWAASVDMDAFGGKDLLLVQNTDNGIEVYATPNSNEAPDLQDISLSDGTKLTPKTETEENEALTYKWTLIQNGIDRSDWLDNRNAETTTISWPEDFSGEDVTTTVTGMAKSVGKTMAPDQKINFEARLDVTDPGGEVSSGKITITKSTGSLAVASDFKIIPSPIKIGSTGSVDSGADTVSGIGIDAVVGESAGSSDMTVTTEPASIGGSMLRGGCTLIR